MIDDATQWYFKLYFQQSFVLPADCMLHAFFTFSNNKRNDRYAWGSLHGIFGFD